jgi:hypothetical protein
VCLRYQFCLFLRIFYRIFELFRQCGIFCFSVRFWNCSDSVVFFVFLLDFWNCSDSVVFFVFLLDFGTVPTVWYFSVRFWNCSDSVVFFAFHLNTSLQTYGSNLRVPLPQFYRDCLIIEPKLLYLSNICQI